MSAELIEPYRIELNLVDMGSNICTGNTSISSIDELSQVFAQVFVS